MYYLLLHHLDRKWANIIAPILYALIVLVTGYFIFEPQAEFKYLSL